MAEEEKESKGSYMLQMRIPTELKEKLEKKAEDTGVALNQYLMFLLIKDAKSSK